MNYRQNILRVVNAEGEGDKIIRQLADPSARRQMFDTRTPPAAKVKFKQRQGARKVKDFERTMALEDGSLTPESATLLRGMSARGNDLSQDRPDVSFSTKELCRDFAVPKLLLPN